MTGAAAKKRGFLKGRLIGRSFPSRRIGNDSKRGSFDALIEEIERASLDRREEPALSGAAFRAGSLIRMMRKARGLTQTALARRIGVTQARISELEGGLGPRGPSWDLMARIAKACSATILISPPESNLAFDAAEPDSEFRWTLGSVES